MPHNSRITLLLFSSFATASIVWSFFGNLEIAILIFWKFRTRVNYSEEQTSKERVGMLLESSCGLKAEVVNLYLLFPLLIRRTAVKITFSEIVDFPEVHTVLVLSCFVCSFTHRLSDFA